MSRLPDMKGGSGPAHRSEFTCWRGNAFDSGAWPSARQPSIVESSEPDRADQGASQVLQVPRLLAGAGRLPGQAAQRGGRPLYGRGDLRQLWGQLRGGPVAQEGVQRVSERTGPRAPLAPDVLVVTALDAP